MNQRSQGFTLIELVIVISIIAILATTILSVLNPIEYQKSARDTLRLSTLNSISQALELYFADNKSYPVDTDANLLLSSLQKYNSRVSFSDPSGCPITYAQSLNGTGYTVTAVKESKGFSVPAGQVFVKVEGGTTVASCSGIQNNNEVIKIYGGQ
jgi:prepilin-type N-terminal cleavage/methylation domain-containing protein